MSSTTPRIHSQQQAPDSIALLQAQSYAYSQAKRARNRRLVALAVVATVTSVAAAFHASDTVSIASLVGLLVGVLLDAIASHRASERVQLAVAIQEKFDTGVFQLPWNALATRTQPSPQEIARLSAKYTGDRFTEPWYPDTGTTARPLDVLICQQSNLGWGAPIHRRWAWTLAAAASVAVLIPAILWLSGALTGFQFLNVVLLSWGPLVAEFLREIRAHLVSARDKEEAHQLLLDLWRTGLSSAISESHCRQVQDEIVHIRLHNATTPDWFDKRQRDENERAMKAAAIAMRNEAAAHGKG